MNSTIAQLKICLAQALVATFGDDYANVDPILVPASNPKFGDYQANVAMSLTKKVGKPPRAIAEQLVQNLDVSDLCHPPTIAGPGFINLTLKPEYLQAELQAMQFDPRLGVAPVESPQRVIVDYPSPNIAKEMHVGHLRSAIIGDCIARILAFVGHDVQRISHVGDWGTPFGMLIAHLRLSYPEALTSTENLDLGDLSTFYRQAKQRFDADAEFREAARLSVVQLQAGDVETLRAWKIVCELSSRSYRATYDLMGILSFIERGESFYNPFLPEVVAELQQLGLLVEDSGAQCVFLEGFTNKDGKPLPLIVKKTDGGYNYATTDLAAIRYRVQVDRVQRVIYPVGSEQINHFIQIFQVGRRAGWITDEMEFVHTPFGLILGDDGQKLKTRSGDAVPLKELLDGAIAHARQDLEKRLQEEGRQESADFIDHVAQVVGISAVKYADLSQNRTSNYIFSYGKMLALQGNTAPYMIYAYVRVQGISRKGQIDFENLGADAKIVLQEETELVLAKHLLQLGEVLDLVTQDLLPNRLCQYLFELSQKFNQFYDRCPVLQAEEPDRTSRLMLCDLTARTLKLGLSLLGIPVLERM
ncbi:MAG: arginine--tRNA ligase [Scytolyngbya sp. HA4215-MV1]|jgi:arginyl-tRNA synthetase|nr:arginine--tRNA ligase [Scytolyngbya sp. HA4215-MV1]